MVVVEIWIGENNDEDNQANNKAKNCSDNTPHQADGAPGGGHASFLGFAARDNAQNDATNANTEEVEDAANHAHHFARVLILWIGALLGCAIGLLVLV